MTYNIFISHSWRYHKQYDNLINLLNEYPYFSYRDYSVPQDDPIDDAPNNRRLKEELENQIRPASCVIFLAGVYASYSKWIDVEIEIAQRMGKKIIAVIPRGNERASDRVTSVANIIVRWNHASIVNAIRGV
ncbi:MAG: TIR domain-containing protein [Coprobacillus sp.]|nr:TIR domain-containing protein [Coprobacillus sp.]